MLTYNDLTKEQKKFIELALQGNNILVDACIGSGKTTAIQCLCNALGQDKHILYLTFNMLLKVDAQKKIKSSSRIEVTNYHGFASKQLRNTGADTNKGDCVQIYNRIKPPVRQIDVLILDEYQDIDLEISEMLEHIKSYNPNLQIIAVGDMAQKIYDWTSLDIAQFITNFLSNKTLIRMEFTRCFRLPLAWAATLGSIWKKKIVGVNPNCTIETMRKEEIVRLLGKCEPKEVLCLGAGIGKRNWLLNELEKRYPDKYNKSTTWAKVSEKDGGSTQPAKDCAIFTTYDGCKGMERDICVVMDWTESYWEARISKAQVKQEIIRNIFCVAASRGKKRIIFAEYPDMLSNHTLANASGEENKLEDVRMSDMFEYKYNEDVEAAFAQLQTQELNRKEWKIQVATHDELIDLSFCIGIYQEVAYFEGCDIKKYIESYFDSHPDKAFRKKEYDENWDLDTKVLYLASLETEQNRYLNQVTLPLVSESTWAKISDRLSTCLSKDVLVQQECELSFDWCGYELFRAVGIADAVKGDTVYELKFVEELSHKHYLQCAMYMVAMGLQKGILWNVKNNQRIAIHIPDVQTFMDKVTQAVTKGKLKKYNGPICTNTAPAVSAAPTAPVTTVNSYNPFNPTAIPIPPAYRNPSVSYNPPIPTQYSAPARPARKAFDYTDEFMDFINDNEDACSIVMDKTIDLVSVGKTISPITLKKMLIEEGVDDLPLSAKTFHRYWMEYCEELMSEDDEDEDDEDN